MPIYGAVENMIPLAKCKDRGIYILRARNIGIGIYNEETKGFVGLRSKFDSTYLAQEFHHDTGAPFGSASPIGYYGQCPCENLVATSENTQLFNWLKSYEYEPEPITVTELTEVLPEEIEELGLHEVFSSSDSSWRHGSYETEVYRRDRDHTFWRVCYQLSGDGEYNGLHEGVADIDRVFPREKLVTVYETKKERETANENANRS